MTDVVRDPLVHDHGYGLADRYRRDDGNVFVSGVQALARLPLEQLRADRREGRNTAAFLSGYPGSPLAGFDREARQAAACEPDLPVVVRPAVNEELAATAVMGSQLAATMPGARYDGVLGLWYGKTPGLDRASDAIRHAVFAGSHPRGGAVLLVGDDPLARSSTLPSSSDATLQALYVPVFQPGDVQDVVELGRHAVALSRAAGLWTAVKVHVAVADGTGTVGLHAAAFAPQLPTMERDGVPFVPAPSGKLLTPHSLAFERELVEIRLELARAYGARNGLNEVTVDPPDAWIGLVAAGHTYFEVLEALRRLGLGTPERIAGAGIRLLRLRMPFPLEPETVRRFARGLGEVMVIEDKRPLLEGVVKEALYGRPDPPVVTGKRDETGAPLLPAYGSLDADQLLAPLRARLVRRVGEERLAPLPVVPARALIPLAVNRTPYFCSGCPHNSSTKVPEGTLVGGGIGCHSMVAMMPSDQVGEIIGLTAMGSEGANWIGMAPFVDTPHIVQNLGDGTYAHSGHLAVRAAIAAGVNVTFKLLYNGAVSMTGGQHAEGEVAVPDLAQLLLSEGAARVLITTDEPDRYDDVRLPAGVEVWGRDRIVEAQEVLARVPGTTVLIHDQACAAEKRRARKRGRLPAPAELVIIDERVCEGCGDCGRVSNCLSVQPRETAFGRKTQIHQSSCNHDLSCLDGDCPSFATVTPARRPRRGARPGRPTDPATPRLPEPVPVLGRDECTVRLSGIGGTGVVTLSQLIGTAAMLDGLEVRGLDQTGLSQKAGPVVSDLRIGRIATSGSNKAPTGTLDVMLALDLLVAAGPAHVAGARAGHTVVIGSTSGTPTGAMVVDPVTSLPATGGLTERLDALSDPGRNRYLDAMALADALFADATAANVMVLGVAVQTGALPVTPTSVERAIELNGVAVARNLEAFRWGRRWVVDPEAVRRAAGLVEPAPPESTAELVERLARDLAGYQSNAYAHRFRRTVERVAAAEASACPGRDELTVAVARNLHKLMAYKDEYEVARLLLAPEARERIEAVAGPGATVVWHLHPPLLAALGVERKLRFGPWFRPVLAVLRSMRRLRGTPLDPFGRTAMRRLERSLVRDYVAALDRIVAQGVTAGNHADAVAIASSPDEVRGYERLKRERAETFLAGLAERTARFTAG